MASNITKILFRRGTDDQRKLVTLNLGEPGITTDTNRLFVGDGATPGGFPAGSINLGAVDALAGGGTGGLNPTTYTFLQGKRPVAGDFIYDKTTGTIFSLSSFQTPVPSLSDFVPYTSQVLFNTSQFTLSGTPPGLSLANQGVNNNNLALAQANSVKANATATVASPQDLIVGSGQIVGNTTGTLNALTLSGQSGVKFVPTSSTVLSVTLTGSPQSIKGNIDPVNEGPVSDITFGDSQIQFTGTSTTGILTAVNVIEGDGISFNAGDRDLTVNTTNSIQHLRYGDMRGSSSVGTVTYNAGDGTGISLYNLNYTTTSFVTFETSALNNKPPLVTVYWMASGASSVTVFATNSSVSPSVKGRWNPNSVVAASFRDGNDLYIGGDFTTLGLSARNRFGLINLSGGNTATSGGAFLGATGILSSIPGSDPFGSKALLNGGSGFNNRVTQILKFATSAGKEYLCVGGSFTAAGNQRGSGLTVFETTNNYLLSGFTFNRFSDGTGVRGVQSLLSAGDYLYVAGSISNGKNPGDTGAGTTLEGLTRINMTTLQIDTTFSANVATSLTNGGLSYPIRSLEHYNGVLYAGGYQIKGTTAANYEQYGLTAHLAPNSNTGTQGTTLPGWNPIVTKGRQVFKVKLDTTVTPPILYVGGNFTTIKTGASNPFQSIPYIAAFALTDPNSPTLLTNWKPTPNLDVTQIDIHDTATPGLSALYVGGNFTKLQSAGVKYLGAVSKADGSATANILNWYPTPGAALDENYGIRSSFIRIPYTHPLSGVLFSGSFTTVGGSYRNYISRTSGYAEAVVGAVSGVSWSVNGNVIDEGAGLDIDTTYTSIVSDIPGLQDTVQTTTFPALSDSFADVNRGDLCRYKLGRTGTPSTGDTYAKPVWLLGVKIDYNS